MAISEPVPRHVAVIMDGNGRWAESRGLPRKAGHEAGADTVRKITKECARLGVEVLTLYSFSTENWGRPEDEVDALMALLEHYLRTEVTELLDNGIRLRGIGQLDRLPGVVRQLMEFVSEATAVNDGMVLQLALSYGSRDEIVTAVKVLARQVLAGELDPEDIEASTLEAHLSTAGLPDPDLIIRTSGELRLSNFLLWQAAYSELYVTDVPWPDFGVDALHVALESYRSRQRRFGRTGKQLEETPA